MMLVAVDAVEDDGLAIEQDVGVAHFHAPDADTLWNDLAPADEEDGV